MSERREINLDERLASAGQTQVRELVKGLADETPSMAWRSGLNEQILAMAAAKQKKRNLFGWVWKPAVGLALAGALAGVFLIRTQPETQPTAARPALEARLVMAHQDAVWSQDAAGAGLSPADARATEVQLEPTWTEEDLSSL